MIPTMAADLDTVVRMDDLSLEFSALVDRIQSFVGGAQGRVSGDLATGISKGERQVDACARAYVEGRCDRGLWLSTLDDYEKAWLQATVGSAQTASLAA